MKKLLSLLLVAAMMAGVGIVPAMAEAAGGLALDSAAWHYDADNDVYWQIGVPYCANPAALDYETLGVYVPGAYMSATDNGDGTYTCTIDADGSIAGYTAATAPIVIPVNTPGYSAMKSPTEYNYSSVSSYLQAGFVYVQAGCRGRNNGYDEAGNLIYDGGAPWALVDLKAAIRYVRYNQSALPGDEGRIFSFGMSGGGAQSALVGATGDSALYAPYLASIGAAMVDADGNALSDAVFGAMCWCPITSLDQADSAYEWMMGQYFDTGTRQGDTWTSALSDDLSRAFAAYINGLGLTDMDGEALTLSESASGIYAAGSYYDYVLSAIDQSLNNFLADTSFPYTANSGGGMMRGERGQRHESGMPDGMQMPEGGFPDGGQMPEGMPNDGIQRAEGDAQQAEAKTYETAQAYIDSLNEGGEWIAYDAATNTAKVASIEAFVTHCKAASKSVGAFDDVNLSQGENQVFGTGASDALHFDATMAQLLAENQATYAAYQDWDASVAAAYQEGVLSTDSLGTVSAVRQDMYNPMYYVSPAYEGYGDANVAPNWRIRTGINQGDTASTVEVNLALALSQYEGVQGVDFETVWAQGHTMAERTGDSTANFIQWVNACCA